MNKLSDKGRKSLKIQFLNNCKKDLEQDKLYADNIYEYNSINIKLNNTDKELLELKQRR